MIRVTDRETSTRDLADKNEGPTVKCEKVWTISEEHFTEKKIKEKKNFLLWTPSMETDSKFGRQGKFGPHKRLYLQAHIRSSKFSLWTPTIKLSLISCLGPPLSLSLSLPSGLLLKKIHNSTRCLYLSLKELSKACVYIVIPANSNC